METISRTSLIYRWAYFGKKHKPCRTDVCVLFWRCVGKGFLALLALTGLILAIDYWRKVLPVFGMVVLTVAGITVVLTAVSAMQMGSKALAKTSPAQLLVAKIEDVKAKRCTLYEVADE